MPTTGECVRNWPAKLRCGEGFTPLPLSFVAREEEDALARHPLATDACQPKTVRTRERIPVNARATSHTVGGQASNHARNVWVATRDA